MQYVNPHLQDVKRSFTDVALWIMGVYKDSGPDLKIPADFNYPKPNSLGHDKAWWINHSTVLIRSGSLHFLTDPIWSRRCSPIPLVGPKRQHPPGISIKDLPQIDAVLLSHNHYDHLDAPSVKALHRAHSEIVWFVPKGVAKYLHRWGIKNIIERSWWEPVTVTLKGEKVTLHAVPAQHFSGRTLSDQNQTLWLGWIVDHGTKRFYFVGDTGYNEFDFKEIGAKFAPIDLALIPIGSYSPRRFMAPVHVEPRDAAKIHIEVSSRQSLAIHWNTFRLSHEPRLEPPYALYLALKNQGRDPREFVAVNPGDLISW